MLTERIATNIPARWQIEWELCDIASDACGVARDDISPASRLIQDLHLDSLCLLDFFMRVEDRFGITIPDDPPPGSIAKNIFTRETIFLADMADVVLDYWETGTPTQRILSKWPTTSRKQASIPFFQFDGTLRESAGLAGDLYIPLPPTAAGPRQFRRRTDGMRCILIPAATVQLGSAEPDAQPDERPQHTAAVSEFLIDAEPVSAMAYARFLNSVGPLPDAILREWFLPADDDQRALQLPLKRRCRKWRVVKGVERRPMMLVSWFGANAYSLWANGRDWRAYRGDGLAAAGLPAAVAAVSPPLAETLFSLLPSEAQWEYAARGPEPQRFPWGDDPPTADLAQVAQREPNRHYAGDEIPSAEVNEILGMSPFGLHHMAGNVWQWCRDWYAPDFYASGSAGLPDPQNCVASGIRSERGGSWVGPADLARSSYRRGRAPEARGRCLGFRCIGVIGDLPNGTRAAG